MDKSFFLREMFHLAFLRSLAPRLAGRSYAVKGGICLRFFHRSPRLSEDMDLDVESRMPIQTLQKNVDVTLAQGAWRSTLKTHGVQEIAISKPKQTETTQRWKVGLILAGGERLATRLEFSRRQESLESEQGIPEAGLLSAMGMPPFASSFYGAAAMVRQKILALASPSRTAARDLFDLHHLFFQVRLDIRSLKDPLESGVVEKAIGKVEAFEPGDFRDQVLPFLPSDLAELYRTSDAFSELRQGVKDRLKEFLL